MIPATKNPVLPDEPPETYVSLSRALLKRGSFDDEETIRIIHIIYTDLMPAHLSQFLSSRIHEDIVGVLWSRLKISPGGISAWSFASIGVLFFE